ncbi:ACP S-malonyltransferase [Alkalimonas collagenimarina]|uniref:[acyl-carrier-protein] S-malonyltransferase n=1 Tax=Alkalimonas collagenimarina TaxID=400390 RepID=A0ABT9H237_9GAMM|nr:ACP S-malonyltransferase [Alkalimonas collagenimarina]MDP4536965.1 ACP S-malonyltransferase [Alkalimonas collagenimarina]
MSLVFMFVGQGSQHYKMAETLFNNNAAFRNIMQRLDRVAIEAGGRSILAKLYSTTEQATPVFDELRYTHPAIYMLEYALAASLIQQGVKPDFVLGSSLGEVVAATIAGCIEPEQGMRFVIEQADIFERYAEAGGMTAILADPQQCSELKLAERGLEIAALNYDAHFVVSGSREALTELEAQLPQYGHAFMRLPVTQAFHSSKLNRAKSAFLELCQKYRFSEPVLPLISSTTEQLVKRVDGDYFWQVVRQVIQFPQAVATAEKLGARHFCDLGPSGTMANFAKRCLMHRSACEITALLNPFAATLDLFNELIATYSHSEQGNKNMSMTNTAIDPTAKVYMFPGQGAQQVGMGRELFDKYPQLIRAADEILGYSIKELCLNGPVSKLSNTQYTQAALYTVSTLSYLDKVANEAEPDVVMGHSLGEFNALFAAGVFSFEDGLRLVKKRGELMAQMSDGGMVAVMKCAPEVIQKVMDAAHIKDIDFANYNSPSQLVLAGPKDSLARLTLDLEDEGAAVVPLNVSAPFHSRYMAQVRRHFAHYLTQFSFANPNKVIISNVHAQPYDVAQLKQCLAMQISSPVRWCDSIEYLLHKGVSNFHEVGHGQVLKNLLAKIQTAWVSAHATQVQSKSSTPAPANVARPTLAVAPLTARQLGSEHFKKKYGLQYAYATGAMYKGIASKALVTRMAKAGFLSFFGTGGLSDENIAQNIDDIQQALGSATTVGMNLVCNLANPDKEMRTVELFMQKGITVIEAAAFLSVTPALVRYRLQGLSRDAHGNVHAANRIMAKISRPEVAEQFLKPAPAHVVKKLLEQGLVSSAQAELAKTIAMADSLCVEADSGGHTDMGVLSVILPTIIRLRDRVAQEYSYQAQIDVGAAGGIGTPESAASALMLGADFILTGSINQCSPEAGTSDEVKALLQDANIHDTRYAPAGDMFEIGAKVQVLRKGVFFPARANKLYELWQRHQAWHEVDAETRDLIEKKYFKRSFNAVYQETCEYYNKAKPQEIVRAEKDSKHKMALVFRWYFIHTNRIAISGAADKVDYQIHCGPSLGAFNQWVKGTRFEAWQNRHVDEIAHLLLEGTAEYMTQKYAQLMTRAQQPKQGAAMPEVALQD